MENRPVTYLEFFINTLHEPGLPEERKMFWINEIKKYERKGRINDPLPEGFFRITNNKGPLEEEEED